MIIRGFFILDTPIINQKSIGCTGVGNTSWKTEIEANEKNHSCENLCCHGIGPALRAFISGQISLQMRQLNQYFLFNKALRRIQRVYVGVAPSTIHFLYAVWCLGGNHGFVAWSAVERFLKSVNRAPNGYRYTKDSLLYIALSGYLIRKEGRYWYKLSVRGTNLLNELDQALESAKV